MKLSHAIAFLVLRLAELVLCTFGALAPSICVPAIVVLRELSERITIPPAPDRRLDLREFYPAR